MAPKRSLWPRSLRSHGFPAQSETRSRNSRAPLRTCVLMSLCQTARWQEFFFSVGAKFWDLLVFQATTRRSYPSSWCSLASACWQVSAGTSFPWHFGLCCTTDGHRGRHRALPRPPAPASGAEVALSRIQILQILSLSLPGSVPRMLLDPSYPCWGGSSFAPQCRPLGFSACRRQARVLAPWPCFSSLFGALFPS